MFKKLLILILFFGFIGCLAVVGVVYHFSKDLPDIVHVKDYKPLLVSEVYDRDEIKIGEFFRERRKMTPIGDIPEIVKQAFISAEDSSFYEHSGVNLTAIARALYANFKAGRRVQGGSTITQQVAKSIVLKNTEKKYSRKIKEAILAYKMEQNLSKEEILYLYLNQIYFGQGAHGVAMATEVYFRKPLSEITVKEAALLAGLPQAPTRYTPIYRPKAAKNRQKYVLKRMAKERYITDQQAQDAINEDLKVYIKVNYEKKAPFFLETIRQTLVKHLGEKALLDEGLKIYTSLDSKKQDFAQVKVHKGIEELDKRQGFRGAKENISEPSKVSEFLLKTRDELMTDHSPLKVIKPDGTIIEKTALNLTGLDKNGKVLPNLPDYIKPGDTVDAIVTSVNDKYGITTVRFAEQKGIIDIKTMGWARKPSPKVSPKWAKKVTQPSKVFKKGDIIQVKIKEEVFKTPRLASVIKAARSKDSWPENIPKFSEYAEVLLEQEPTAQGALLSLDNETGDILAMVGGYNFDKSKYNCAIQASRQTGSSFKAFVYSSALDHGYTPASILIDAPLVFKNKRTNWKPNNYSHKFKGDILFRSSIAQSLNIPTIKLIMDMGVTWVADYSKRLGIFSPLNMDLTLALGSSSVTLYEMTKAFSHFPRLGKKMEPIIIHKVLDQNGKEILGKISLDDRFGEEINRLNTEMENRKNSGFAGGATEEEKPEEESIKEEIAKEDGEEKAPGGFNDDEKLEEVDLKVTYKPQFFFDDPNQLIKPTTAYLTTSVLRAAVTEPGATGLRVSSIGRPVAGKTGTTNEEYDAWFIGYTPQITTGVWAGYLKERSLGAGEGGGKTALPIWLGYMKLAHEELEKKDFKVPGGIVFSNIDSKSGKIASEDSERVFKQPFLAGTQPTESEDTHTDEDTKNFYKDDLAD